jgi:membrane protease YdiL (CAAX protease family)
MLFLLKRTWRGALAGLIGLAILGLAWRAIWESGPAYAFSVANAALGIAVVAVVILSDVLLHGLLLALFRDGYRWRHRELVQVFQGQTWAAILAGAAMAGIGEELVFRGLGTGPVYLTSAAVLFGLLHHIRRRLWPFTLWAMYQGFWFAGAVSWTGALSVTMVAHFLHDLAGFLIFRYLNRHPAARARIPPVPVP